METSKYKHLTQKFCHGNGVDIGCGSDPVVPWAITLEQPGYSRKLHPVNLLWDAITLPFRDQTLDWVYASHILEDFLDWTPILKEWTRVIKPHGNLIVLIPDHESFRAAVECGQPDNLAHQHEGRVGELSEYAPNLGLNVLQDRFATGKINEYTILFIARKLP